MCDEALVFGIHYALPGAVQTVPRAELSAVVTLVEGVCEGAQIQYMGDNQKVIESINKGREHCKKATNNDLYELLFQYLDDNRVTLVAKWIPSHLDTEPEKERPEWVTHSHIAGNGQADRLAGIAADLFQIRDLNITRRVVHYTYLTKRIQTRLATIVCNLPNRPKQFRYKAPKEAAPSRQALISLSHHSLVLRGNTLFCTVCKSRLSHNSPTLRAFLGKECEVPRAIHTVSHHGDRPYPINTTIQIASTSTHSSHKLYSYRGVVFCNVCGCVAQARLRGLAKMCRGTSNVTGQRVKDRLAHGLLPYGMLQWPDESFNVPRHETVLSSPRPE